MKRKRLIQKLIFLFLDSFCCRFVIIGNIQPVLTQTFLWYSSCWGGKGKIVSKQTSWQREVTKTRQSHLIKWMTRLKSSSACFYDSLSPIYLLLLLLVTFICVVYAWPQSLHCNASSFISIACILLFQSISFHFYS